MSSNKMVWIQTGKTTAIAVPYMRKFGRSKHIFYLSEIHGPGAGGDGPYTLKGPLGRIHGLGKLLNKKQATKYVKRKEGGQVPEGGKIKTVTVEVSPKSRGGKGYLVYENF